MAQFLAIITPIDPSLSVGGGPVYPQPPVDPGYGIPIGGFPSHPIAPPPGYPAHPIYTPPGIWGGAPLPFPTPPIYYPPVGGGTPEHPIFLPPPGEPSHPIYIPSPVPPAPGEPAHPIVIPPPRPDAPLEPKVGWTAMTGWVVVYVPSDTATIPTPSGAPGKK